MRWLRRGLPHRKEAKGKRKGMPRLLFDIAVADAWIAQNGRVSTGRMAAARTRAEGDTPPPLPDPPPAEQRPPPAPEPTPPPPRPAAPATPKQQTFLNYDLAREPGVLGSLERLKIQEFQTAQLMLRLKKEGKVADVMALQRQYTQEVIALREGERAAAEYREATGDLVQFSEMTKNWERLAVAVKNSVLAIASMVSAEIQRFLRDPEDVVEVVALIDKHARNALIHININEPPSTSEGDESVSGGAAPSTEPDR